MMMLGFLLSGTVFTIFMKWQNSLVGVPTPPAYGEYEPGALATFNHPYFQTMLGFLGEILCIGFYAVKVLILKAKCL
jgi:hypothetical protein